MMNKLIPIIIVVALVVGGGAFWGGMQYSQSKSPTGQFAGSGFSNLSAEERQQRMDELGANVSDGFRGGFNSGQRTGGDGFVTGEIIAKDDQSVTVKLQDGGSKIIFLSQETEITKFSQGTLDDLVVGNNVMVSGSANTDGTLTAQTIQLGPISLPQ